ncbi:hypothetical protein [Persephonella sp.]
MRKNYSPEFKARVTIEAVKEKRASPGQHQNLTFILSLKPSRGIAGTHTYMFSSFLKKILKQRI